MHPGDNVLGDARALWLLRSPAPPHFVYCMHLAAIFISFIYIVDFAAGTVAGLTTRGYVAKTTTLVSGQLAFRTVAPVRHALWTISRHGCVYRCISNIMCAMKFAVCCATSTSRSTTALWSGCNASNGQFVRYHRNAELASPQLM
jgi:hypothetical protein